MTLKSIISCVVHHALNIWGLVQPLRSHPIKVITGLSTAEYIFSIWSSACVMHNAASISAVMQLLEVHKSLKNLKKF